MKTRKLRIVIPLIVLCVAGLGFALSGRVGTLSAFGWEDIALLCPLGALGAMLASKLLIPRAVISLAVALVVVLLVGRAFCAWVCPIPLVQRLRDVFSPKKGKAQRNKSVAPTCSASCSACSAGCANPHEAVSSRHFVLGGALVSTLIFGFPVFCLVCPIGLSFATVFLFVRLFSAGDVTWTVVVAPVLLVTEVLLMKKWCHRFCPLGALMSLVAKANRTFRPVANTQACIEYAGKACGRCAEVCPEGIDPRHPERGASLSECTRCRACVEACPGHAISLPLLSRKGADDGSSTGTSAEMTSGQCAGNAAADSLPAQDERALQEEDQRHDE